MKIHITIQENQYYRKQLRVDTGSSVSPQELAAIERCCDALHSPSSRREWAAGFARQIIREIKDEKGRTR